MSLTTPIPSKALADHQDAAARARVALVGVVGTFLALQMEQAIRDMEDAARDLEATADGLAGFLDEQAGELAACTCGADELVEREKESLTTKGRRT